jgi:tetratricopeptide (TPR) repeat protein
MMVEDLLRRGGECEAAGDSAGAEAAYREADQLDDAEGAILLGLILRRRGETHAAAEAFLRAEARGHREAGSCLGNMLCDNGDIEGAKSAYERSIAAGSADALLNLGLMLAQQGAADEALLYLKRAQENGDVGACWAVGRILEDRDDLTGAAAAYRQGAVGGDAQAAFGLGAVLTKLNDLDGACEAFQRAHELGHEGAGAILERLKIEVSAKASAEEGVKWAQLYAASCNAVLAAANACLEVANQAVGARNMAAQRPQHEMSIETFTAHAQEAEREFAPLYQSFAETSTTARGAAAQLLASQDESLYAEAMLAASVEESALNTVATVKSLLGATFGPSPSAFLQGIAQANELMTEDAGDENIYRPPAAQTSDERVCPWCAETIKAAAVICRFCNRDIQGQPTAR